jgi:phosphomannomutase
MLCSKSNCGYAMNTITIDELMQSSNVGFGTSGARGLVKDMSDQVCYLYTCGFIQYLEHSGQMKTGSPIALAGDLRPSSKRIMAAIQSAIEAMGHTTTYCGEVATPVLANYALQQDIAGIMVTGSHIPDDRNGIKFYKAVGEILKHDEEGIRQQKISLPQNTFNAQGDFLQTPTLPAPLPEAEQRYIQRLVDFFPKAVLQGLHVAIYQHSSVIRDTLTEVLRQMGAEVSCLARSETFIPVDTEAVRPEDIQLAQQWAQEQGFDAIASTDGDGDRPMLADAQGHWLRGDILGILCARYLQADIVATPISSNTAVEACGEFQEVIRTRIGSPYVIAAMESAMKRQPRSIVVGYEANGGFLQASPITREGGTLSPLPTRDSTLVIAATLALAQQTHQALSELLRDLPQRFTFSDRIKNVPTQTSQEFVGRFDSGSPEQDINSLNKILGQALGTIVEVDHTDGLRITLANGNIVHYRPSGNAPELRCYTESNSEEAAISLNKQAMDTLLSILQTTTG